MGVSNNISILSAANRMTPELHHFARGTYPVTGRKFYSMPVNRFFMVIANPGKERCRISDEKNSFVLKEGHAYFAPLNHPCLFQLDRELEFVSIHFTLELYEAVDLFSSFGRVAEVSDSSFLRRALKAFECSSEFSAALQLRAVVADFAALHSETMTEEQWENVTRFALFQKELAYLQNRPPARVTVEELSRVRGVSRENFSRSFTRMTGITPKQFLTSMIVSRACCKLLSEQRSIREIAFELGFVNEFYFSRFFRKHTGVPPKEYRSRTLLK
jgi:AraC-like DNA-binding protein